MSITIGAFAALVPSLRTAQTSNQVPCFKYGVTASKGGLIRQIFRFLLLYFKVGRGVLVILLGMSREKGRDSMFFI